MGDMRESFDALKEVLKEDREFKTKRNFSFAEQKFSELNIPYGKYTEWHWHVGDYNYWPSTGKFIHVKSKKSGRGIFNLLRALGIKK